MAGVRTETIVDALYLSDTLNVVNRRANAFDFDWRNDADRMKLAVELNRMALSRPELPAALTDGGQQRQPRTDACGARTATESNASSRRGALRCADSTPSARSARMPAERSR